MRAGADRGNVAAPRAAAIPLARGPAPPYRTQCKPTDPGQNGHPDPDAVSFRAARGWLVVRSNDSSYRALAAEIGISKSSVEKLVNEGQLPRGNLVKLIRWFLKDRRARYGAVPDDEYMEVAVLESLRSLAEADRPAALRQTVEHYERLHDEHRAPRPAWLVRLRALVDRGGGDAPPPGEAAYPVRRGPRKGA